MKLLPGTVWESELSLDSHPLWNLLLLASGGKLWSRPQAPLLESPPHVQTFVTNSVAYPELGGRQIVAGLFTRKNPVSWMFRMSVVTSTTTNVVSPWALGGSVARCKIQIPPCSPGPHRERASSASWWVQSSGSHSEKICPSALTKSSRWNLGFSGTANRDKICMIKGLREDPMRRTSQYL